MNNIMSFFIVLLFSTSEHFSKFTLLVIFSVIFKKMLMHRVSLLGNGCDSPALPLDKITVSKSGFYA